MEILDSGRCVINRIKLLYIGVYRFSFETYQPTCQSNGRTTTRVSEERQQADNII